MFRPLVPNSRANTARKVGLSAGDSRLAIPPVSAGMRIGLLGGSFDPPHEGHLHVARVALNRLGLTRIWWMVTPGNPLKTSRQPSALARRLDAASDMAADPRIVVTGFEARLGSTYTAEVLAFLRTRRRQAGFVWIMGADNLLSFHRWEHWRTIMTSTPIAVIDRPGARFAAQRAVAAQAFRDFRVDQNDARTLATCQAPAWTLITCPLSDASSTRLRARAGETAMDNGLVHEKVARMETDQPFARRRSKR